MLTIMCTRELWRLLGGRGTLPDRPAPEEDGTRLGVWAAKSVVLPEGCFCVALNEVTYMTVLFPLLPLPAFLGAFAAAMALELEHIGIPDAVIETEMQPFFDEVLLAKNSNRSLLGSLNDVCLQFDWAMEKADHSDPYALVRIQQQLNEMSHMNREVSFPVEAVALLLCEEGSA